MTTNLSLTSSQMTSQPSYKAISYVGLIPGQWIVFSNTDEPKSKECLRGPYKVISRDDHYALFGDPCDCFLMDAVGNLTRYKASQYSLDLQTLHCKSRIQVVSKKEIEKIFGKNLEKLQTLALEHLKKLAQTSDLDVKVFNPMDESKILFIKDLKEKYSAKSDPSKNK